MTTLFEIEFKRIYDDARREKSTCYQIPAESYEQALIELGRTFAGEDYELKLQRIKRVSGDALAHPSAASWKWYGHACHSAIGARCQFHMATNIGDKFLVSTIGEWVDHPTRPDQVVQSIGGSPLQLYETLVFKLAPGSTDLQPNVQSFSDIAGGYAATREEAHEQHMRLCNHYQDMLEVVRRVTE